MTDWTCFAYYSSNNTFCSTPLLSTSLVVNVFFFCLLVMLDSMKNRYCFLFFFFFCHALNKQNNIMNNWEISPGTFRYSLFTSFALYMILSKLRLRVTPTKRIPLTCFSRCNKFCSAGCGDTAFFFFSISLTIKML